MGIYLETPFQLDKAMQLKRDHGAQVVNRPEHLSDIPKDKTLVCVVENGLFDAAGIAYSQEEMESFAHYDGRPKTWMLIDTTEVISMKPHLAKNVNEDGTWDLRK